MVICFWYRAAELELRGDYYPQCRQIGGEEGKRMYCIHFYDSEKGDGFVYAMWCGEEECEDTVKAETGVGSRCIPFEQEALSDKCVCCGKPAKKLVYWGKAY